ncbi:MAG: SidA/IucD/PvdA family monooxygenase [Proteobacteria bacterium]|nr:SidA/IucD/PvdA family monooxygenase [Pseudomonadota bacterium]
MQTPRPIASTKLAIVGCGPKALAVAAKGLVLRQLGFEVPEIVVFEKSEVAHHWRAQSGLTNGNLDLGTAPDKDVGFPYYSFHWGDGVNHRINALMQKFSWQSYLVDEHEFSDWIDRGKPAPRHCDWADYLTWVFRQLKNDITYHQMEVTELSLAGNQWLMKANNDKQQSIELKVDGVMITGPGEAKLPPHIPVHERILNVPSFWRNFQKYADLSKGSVAVVGAGETAATVAASLGFANSRITLDIISPQAMAFSRGESYAENHVYTDPFQANWLQLTKEDRRNFINRTDRGVFSVAMQAELDHLRNVSIVPGYFQGVDVDSLDQLLVHVEYALERETRIYDLVILSAGFDHADFARNLLSAEAQKIIQTQIGKDALTAFALEDEIDHFLAVKKFQPFLHLPMLAGLSQGPGFPNLSCLGRLSDHVLARYVPVDFVASTELLF